MCKHLTALNLRSEAEGTRTLNLRIDSPMPENGKCGRDRDLRQPT